MPVNSIIQLRKGTGAEWSSANPVLSSGEPGFDTTNQVLKIGDGSTSWDSLQSISLLSSGTSGYVSKFITPTSIDNSVIYQSGSNIGIGTTSPGKPLEISYNHPTDYRKTGGLRLTNPTSSSPSYLEFGVGGSAGYDRYGICSLNDVAVFRIRTDGSMEFASSFYSPANINWTNTNNANAYINLNNGAGVFKQSCLTSMEFQVSSSTIASLTSAGFATNTLRLGASATSGSIIGLSTTATVPALIFDTVGNNHGFNQSLYEIRENGTALFSIDGNGNFNTGAGNFVATATNPSTELTGAFGGHGMRRRIDSAGMEFAWGGAITSPTEPGIDLFPISNTHISNGILFRLSKNSTKTDVAMIVNGSGNVGIGTSTPSTKLDIAGSVNIDGNITFDSFTESVVTIGNSSTSQTLSLESGTIQTCTLTDNCTFTMPTATAGKSFTMFLNTGSGNYTASFSGVLWSDSAPPTITITASKVDILSFISDGSYWYGSYSQNYG